jgi:hypothetical protein
MNGKKLPSAAFVVWAPLCHLQSFAPLDDGGVAVGVVVTGVVVSSFFLRHFVCSINVAMHRGKRRTLRWAWVSAMTLASAVRWNA